MSSEQALKIAPGRVLHVLSSDLSRQRFAAACFACAIAVIGRKGPSGEPNPTITASPAPAVAYICANDFDLQNLSSTALTVHFAVAGSTEQGEPLLPPQSAGSPSSTTRLTTLSSGALQVSTSNAVVAPVANSGTACAPSPRQEPQATSGEAQMAKLPVSITCLRYGDEHCACVLAKRASFTGGA